jgi:hypothetical protein
MPGDSTENVAGRAAVQASNRLLQGEAWWVEVERALGDSLLRRRDLPEHVGDVDSPVGRGEGCESSRRLLELPPRCDGTTAAGLVPSDRDMDEALEEIPLLRRRRAPRLLELLVRLEVTPGANFCKSALERSLHLVLTFRRGDDPALWGR